MGNALHSSDAEAKLGVKRSGRLTGDAAARASVVPLGVTVVQTAASSASSSARLASTLALTNKVTTTSTHTDDNNKQSAVAYRKDAPVSAPSRRFDKSIALRAAENDEEKKRALEELERDVSSSSTKPTLYSMGRLWHELHRAWYLTGEWSLVWT